MQKSTANGRNDDNYAELAEKYQDERYKLLDLKVDFNSIIILWNMFVDG